MKWRSVFGFIPVPVFYTDRLPDGVGGAANGPVIRLRPKYDGDEGLHQHELEHVRQWWRTLSLHSFLYLLSRRYRMWSEARAYERQTHFPRADGSHMTLDEAAARLAGDHYGFGITVEQAKEYLLRD